jgi:predicted anti-sigma-YlaC factor YlaD
MDAMRKAISKIMRSNPRRCEEARSLMSDYLEGDIDQAARKRVEQHVRFCDRCHTVLSNLRHTLTRLRGLQDTEPPGSDVEAVAARIGQRWRERA